MIATVVINREVFQRFGFESRLMDAFLTETKSREQTRIYSTVVTSEMVSAKEDRSICREAVLLTTNEKIHLRMGRYSQDALEAFAILLEDLTDDSNGGVSGLLRLQSDSKTADSKDLLAVATVDRSGRSVFTLSYAS